MGALSDWAKKNSRFISIDDGETIQAIYRGFKIVANSRDPDKEKVVYRLGIALDDGSETVKAWETSSGKVAKFMDMVKEGTAIKITRHGILTDTSYDLEVIGGGKVVSAKDDADESPF